MTARHGACLAETNGMVRRVALIAGWLVLVFSAASRLQGHETDDSWIRGIFTGGSPRPVQLTETEAWQQASQLAEMTPGAFVLVGGGMSMQPLYAPGTILVMQQCAYEKLQRGQTALYRNKAHKVVAHVLIAKVRDGWRVAGLNNRIHDMEPVLADNLVGVVIAAFKPLSGHGALQVALAGP
jgi:hypothetical protein